MTEHLSLQKIIKKAMYVIREDIERVLDVMITRGVE